LDRKVLPNFDLVPLGDMTPTSLRQSCLLS